jgi:hypothetical protein
MRPERLDHVALDVSDPDHMAAMLCARLPFPVLERTGEFVLVGRSPELGKITFLRARGSARTGRTSPHRTRMSLLRREPDALPPDDDDRSAGRTTEQDVAAGEADWTPVALLTSVVGVIAVLFVAVLALVMAAYLLA